MEPGEIPADLQSLSGVEEQLIGRIATTISVHLLNMGVLQQMDIVAHFLKKLMTGTNITKASKRYENNPGSQKRSQWYQ